MKKFLDNFEEYLCGIGLVTMTIFTFIGVISRKLPQINLSWTMELVTTMFVWVCCLASAAAFKTDSHMGFDYITGKFKGPARIAHKILRIVIIFANYGVWIALGSKMVLGQMKSGLVTPVLSTPGWLIGIAIPVSAVLTIIRIAQYELGYKFGEQKGEQ